jgi:hypothetical protein
MFSICYAIYINCIVTQHDSSNINSLQSVGEVLSNFSIDGILFLLFAEKSPSLPSRSIHAPFHVCLHRVTSPLHRPSTAPLAWLHWHLRYNPSFRIMVVDGVTQFGVSRSK